MRGAERAEEMQETLGDGDLQGLPLGQASLICLTWYSKCNHSEIVCD